MARGITYVVYVLPVVFSVIFGSVVMAGILQEPDRELNLLRFNSLENTSQSKDIQIIGLERQYSITTPIQIQVIINDESLSCGDLYITIFSSENEPITQSAYLNQCFNEENRFLPIDDRFSEVIETSGNYKIVAEILGPNQKKNITTSEEFIVR